MVEVNTHEGGGESRRLLCVNNNNTQYFKRCGAAEACVAHNHKVVGSKPTIAIKFDNKKLNLI